MKLVKLAIFASLSQTDAKKQKQPKPTYIDCAANGVTFSLAPNTGDVDCTSGKCEVTCRDGFQRMGGKKFQCKKNKKSKFFAFLSFKALL